MQHIYCISGLGADHRIFQKLKIENAELHFIHWELPHEKDDMRSYALRLAKQISHSEIILMGVSFGGMLATEITRFYSKANTNGAAVKDVSAPWPLEIKKTILVSSCKSRDEFPNLMRLVSRLRLHKAIPYNIVLHNTTLNRFVFDLKSKEEELYLKRLMLEQNDARLIKRSVNIIMRWKNALPNKMVHIHGTADRLLTPANITPDYWIEGGGHFMVWNKATEISGIINSVLKS
jgi:pimeloyl-ACP methyl ester carboxylesterase